MAAYAFIALLALGLASSAHAQVAGCLGIGSTAQAPILLNLRRIACMAGLPPYAAAGSKAGRDSIGKRTYDYALSDVPLQSCSAASSTLVNVAYAVGLMSVYTRAGATRSIRLSGCGLAGIYTGRVRTWNAPQLTAANPALRTVTAGIKAIIRSDSSGTTWTFTNLMAKTCRSLWVVQQIYSFSEKPILAAFTRGAIRAPGTSGVSRTFAATPNSICYIGTRSVPAVYFSYESAIQSATNQRFWTSAQTNFGALAAGLNLGSPFCSALTDITGKRADTYPFAYLAWWLTWKKANRPNKPCVNRMCLCLTSPAAQAQINTAGPAIGFRGLPAAIRPQMAARCTFV